MRRARARHRIECEVTSQQLLGELRTQRGVGHGVVAGVRTRLAGVHARRERFGVRVEIGVELSQGFAPFVIQSRNSL